MQTEERQLRDLASRCTWCYWLPEQRRLYSSLRLLGSFTPNSISISTFEPSESQDSALPHEATGFGVCYGALGTHYSIQQTFKFIEWRSGMNRCECILFFRVAFLPIYIFLRSRKKKIFKLLKPFLPVSMWLDSLCTDKYTIVSFSPRRDSAPTPLNAEISSLYYCV